MRSLPGFYRISCSNDHTGEFFYLRPMPVFVVRHLKRFFIFLIAFAWWNTTWGKTDTTRIRTLITEAKEILWDQKEEAFQKLYKAKTLMGKLPYRHLGADLFFQLSNIHEAYNSPDSCIFYGNKAIEMYTSLNNQKGVANCYNVLGSNCYNTGDFTEGLSNYIKALNISEQIGDSIKMAAVYNNIGNIYDKQADKERALEYYRKAEKLNLKSGKKSWLGINYNNIGLLFEEERKLPEALVYLKKSYELQKELNNNYDMALAVVNMGNCYSALGKRDSAYWCYRVGWKLYQQLDVPEGIARCKVNLARMMYEENRLDSALLLGLEALHEAERINSANVKEFAHQYLSEIYSRMGNFKQAYLEHKAYMSIRDSVAGTERIAETAQLEATFKFRQDRKADSLRHAQEIFQQSLVAAQQEVKQRYIRYSLLVVILLLAGFGVYVFINFRRKTKLSEALRMQKEIVEEKNKEITQSITYAKRIQHSLLPDENFLDHYFDSSFVFFRPKDIVSGDFYWFREKGEYVQVVLADCTGHGVPGAMMSVMSNTFLQEAAEETQPGEPQRLLEVLDKKITTALRAKDSTTSDGLDCIVISYHRPTSTVYLASAKRPVLLVSGQDIFEIPGSKFSIGGSEHVLKTFSLVTHTIRKNDLLYLFTDGITDQFGGEKGKKLKYANFKKTILEHLHAPLKQQLHALDHSFEKWKGNVEQTDDVCVIGIRF